MPVKEFPRPQPFEHKTECRESPHGAHWVRLAQRASGSWWWQCKWCKAFTDPYDLERRKA